MNKIVVPIGIALVCLFIRCSNKQHETTEQVKLTATSPLVVDTIIENRFVSQIQSIRHIEIRSLEKGYLEKVLVDEGQFVKKGQLLFQIQPMLYSAEASKYQAELEAANIELQNTQSLADKNIVAPNELALAKAKVSKAKAELALANTHLHFTRIVAPYDGIIGRFEKKLGSVVDEGELITTLSDNSKMWVYFNVPEIAYLNYKSNPESSNEDVNLLMANHQEYMYPGKVETIEADFNNETGNIAFRATFPNPDNLLRNGETGNILMKLPVKGAVIIPQKASFEIMDKRYVYTIDAQNAVHLTLITILAEMPDLFIVKTGLTGKEKIVLDGIRRVQDKDQISFDFIQPRTVFQNLRLASE